MFKKLMLLIVVTVSLSSCSNSLIDTLERVSYDPKVVSPKVDSFLDEGSIEISWDADIAADSYVIYRSLDSATPEYKEVYRGTVPYYKDTNLTLGQCYLYTLGKVRGAKVFGPSAPVLGVSSSAKRDIHEPNDSKEGATSLVTPVRSNLYYYASPTGQFAKDVDWYSVEIPPSMKALITVEQEGLSDILTWMEQAAEYSDFETVVNNNTFIIINEATTYKTCYFRIQPIVEKFLTSHAHTGGNIINYTITLSQYVSASGG